MSMFHDTRHKTRLAQQLNFLADQVVNETYYINSIHTKPF
jgi:hypothetical protein